MSEQKVFEMFIVSEGNIEELVDFIDSGYPSEEIIDRLREVLTKDEYNQLQTDRLEIFVTKDCYQVHIDGFPVWEYRGPDARSYAAGTRVHGINTDEDDGRETVLIAGWWGFKRIWVKDEKFTERTIHPDFCEQWGDNWPPIMNLRD